MAHWTIQTTPARPGAALTGQFSDPDRQARLRIFVDTLARLEAERDRAQRRLDAELTAARRQGQDELADQAVKDLAERRARALAG